MYNRITYDLAFGYLGIMDDMILVQVIGYLVILNLFLHFFKKNYFQARCFVRDISGGSYTACCYDLKVDSAIKSILVA